LILLAIGLAITQVSIKNVDKESLFLEVEKKRVNQ
jgi:hypothetical protein